MRMIIKKAAFLHFFLLIVPLSLISCGGSGGSSPAGPVISKLNAQFTPSAPSPPSNSVTLQKESLSKSIVYIKILATQVTGVYDATFSLDYDSTKVKWTGQQFSGGFFETSAVPLYAVALDGGVGEGRLVVGVTLTGGATPVSGDGVIITIPFQVIKAGTSSIDFDVNAALYDNTLTAIAGPTWSGGDITGS